MWSEIRDSKRDEGERKQERKNDEVSVGDPLYTLRKAGEPVVRWGWRAVYPMDI